MPVLEEEKNEEEGNYTVLLAVLTAESFSSFTTNRSLTRSFAIGVSAGWNPPNMAALLPPKGVREKLEHGGGECPVTVGELHLPVRQEHSF